MRFSLLKIVAVILILISLVSSAQELPPIQNFTPQQYNAETQNWSIAQDHSKTIYVANNNGLLSFDGEQWQNYPSPNQSIIRSVNVINEKIYTGMYMEFGYWVKNEYGTLTYSSLSSKLRTPIKEDEQFWKIVALQDWILFQSLDRIYIYNSKNKEFNIIDSDNGIFKIFKTNESIYFQKNNLGLYRIQEGKEKLVSNLPLLVDNRIINVHEFNNTLLVITEGKGIFQLNDGILTPLNRILNDYLERIKVYNAIQLNDGNYALGTISNGCIIVNNKGEIIYNLDQSNGLANNTVLSLYEDVQKNLWLGLDNGITCINMYTPINVYNDENGALGSVYASQIINNKLYLGTNQGLYYKDIRSNEEYKLVEGTKGQVWYLFNYNNELFCGHDSGTFIINDTKASRIGNVEGTWIIRPIENRPNLLLQGNYDGLYVLQESNGQWQVRNKIDNYEISSKFLEFTDTHNVIISHEYKGIIQLKLDQDYRSVIKTSTLEELKGLKSSIIKHNDNIYYAYKNGIYIFNKDKNNFVKDVELSNLFDFNSFRSGKLISDSRNNRLWLFTRDKLYFKEPGSLSSEPKIISIPLPYDLIKNISGYDNIMALDNNKYLVGSTTGYLTIDLNNISENKLTTRITSITNAKERNENLKTKVRIDTTGSFPNRKHNLEFTYSLNEYDKYFKAQYQYKLVGIYDDWSKWTNETKQVFENLPFGDYTFLVRGKLNNQISENIAEYKFTITRPWYLSNLLIALYFIGIVFIAFIVNNSYKRYYKRQQQEILDKSQKKIELKELENQKQIMRMQNASLEKDIENKNRELAISTMSLIKKNEVLNNIKNELKDIKGTELKGVIKLIDRNINNQDDWKLFEEAFNNADKDFLKKVKSKHEALTPNDLRLCAYLRLNLSSKEIAPLLNISPRSVEVKRYRLRKKMNLPHEASLTNYLIEF